MDSTEVQETFKWTNVGHQYFVTIAVNLIALAQGCSLGWVSPALPILASNSTPLSSGPLTNDEVSWIGSVSCIGGLLGSLSLGYFTIQLGSKIVILGLAVPAIASWLLIGFGSTYYHVLIARFIAGFSGGGIQSTVVLFISEIANDDIRGRLGSVTCFLRHIGILFEYILGASVEYEYIPYISILVPISFLIIFIMIPNTPRYYLCRGKTQKAEKSLMFYKGCKEDNQLEYSAICEELERLKVVLGEQKQREQFQFSDFCNRSALKGLGIGIVLTTFAAFSANFPLTSYAVMTFTIVGTYMDPYLSSIMVAVALILGSLTSSYFADILGRRMLNLISLMGSACGLLATALYHYLNLIGYDLSAFEWIPVFCLSLVIFITSAGIVPLSLICSVEYLPCNVRTYGMAIISCSFSLVNFLCVKMYPIFLELVDLHGCLMIYSIGCIIGFVYVLIFLNETSGQSLDNVGIDEKTKHERKHRKSIENF